MINGNNVRNISSRVGSSKEYEERVELVLVLLSNSYLLLDSILVSTSRLSSYFILYHLLTI